MWILVALQLYVTLFAAKQSYSKADEFDCNPHSIYIQQSNYWVISGEFLHLFIYLNLNYLYNSSKRDGVSKNRQNAWWISVMSTFLHSLTSLYIKPHTVPRTTWGVGNVGSSLPADAEETSHARQSHNYSKVQNASSSFCWDRWG